ncbi:MAG: alanine racemase, partial [bacterium]
MKNSKNTRPVWLEINLDNIKYNFEKIKENVSQETFIMAVVKADAYGHGVIPVVKTLVEAGCDRLAVALPEEGKEIRKAGYRDIPIHVLGEVFKEQIPLLFEYNLIPTISKDNTIKKINSFASKRNKKKKVHIKIDTGMGRIGLFPSESVKFIEKVNKMNNIEIEGILTHFANADEKDKNYTYKQWNTFKNVVNKLEEREIYISLKHVANSAAIIDLPDMQMDMVRPGIMLYGLKPSPEVKNIDLKPALSWKAKIVYLKEVPPGSGISYGTTFVTSRRSSIATLPLGYADGY